MKYLKKSYLLENDILLALINIENEYWVLLVLYPILGKAVYFYSLLSFSDISEKIQPLFPCINCYCKLHNIEKNWKILVHNLTHHLTFIMHPDDINENLSFQNLPDNSIETENIDYISKHQQTSITSITSLRFPSRH